MKTTRRDPVKLGDVHLGDVHLADVRLRDVPPSDDATRFCPHCDVEVDDDVCPIDQVMTLRVVATEYCQRLRAGDVVGSFRLVALLGQGGFGAVWRAQRLTGIGEVAVKILHADGADRGTLRRFFREAVIGARLRHGATARILEFGQHAGGALWMAMELLVGHTLKAELQHLAAEGRAMEPARAASLAVEVLGALAEAHAEGIVHRDIKPENLMLVRCGGQEHIKLLDFGVARLLGTTMTEAGRVVGTAHTMAPEQCSRLEVDGRSDLYSLGVVLFRCLAGQWPFAEADSLQIMFAHIHHPAPDVTLVARQPISAALSAVVARALAKQPEDRFEDAVAMRAALVAALEHPDAVLQRAATGAAEVAAPASSAAGVPLPALAASRPAARTAAATSAAALLRAVAWSVTGAVVAALAIRTATDSAGPARGAGGPTLPAAVPAAPAAPPPAAASVEPTIQPSPSLASAPAASPLPTLASKPGSVAVAQPRPSTLAAAPRPSQRPRPGTPRPAQATEAPDRRPPPMLPAAIAAPPTPQPPLASPAAAAPAGDDFDPIRREYLPDG